MEYEIGKEYLYYSNGSFDTCRIIRNTSAQYAFVCLLKGVETVIIDSNLYSKDKSGIDAILSAIDSDMRLLEYTAKRVSRIIHDIQCKE